MKTKTAYTLGPWYMEIDEVIAANGVPIACIYGAYNSLSPNTDHGECVVNARLIAMAPSAMESLARISTLADRAANGGLDTPGCATRIGDLKRALRDIRDEARAILREFARGEEG